MIPRRECCHDRKPVEGRARRSGQGVGGADGGNGRQDHRQRFTRPPSGVVRSKHTPLPREGRDDDDSQREEADDDRQPHTPQSQRDNNDWDDDEAVAPEQHSEAGERSRGFEGFWAQLEGYPDGGVETWSGTTSRLLPEQDRWAITPAYTVVPLASPADFTVLMRAQYPDGSWWHILVVVEMRDERIYRTTNYFAPELPAPLAESIAAYQHS